MEKLLTAENISCYHCGDPVKDVFLRENDKFFCCEGCHTVYSILSENGLCNYYHLESHPGVKKPDNNGRYDWLDDEEALKKLLSFHEGNTCVVSLSIPKIHCSSCIWLLENLPRLIPGVSASKVNFLKKEATITFNNDLVSLKDIAGTLSSIGYSPEFNLSAGRTEPALGDKMLLYRLGVAGFCFGNIMLLSFPEYLGLSEEDEAYRNFFGYANILLALPVLFFCSTGYFRSAWQGLRSGNLNLDLPIAAGILVFFGRSAWEILSHTGAGYMDSLAGLLFFMLTGKWFQSKTYSALSFERDYRSYFPAAVTRINQDGTEETVLTDKLRRNDQLLIRNREIIPADARLLEGTGAIDYSFVTGESVPVRKSCGDLLFAGGRQTGPAIKILLEKEVSQSYLTGLWNRDELRKEKTGGFGPITSFLGRFFSLGVLALALVTGIYWLAADPDKWVQAVAAVLIVACPCAIALSIPFTFGNVMRLFGRNGFYLKNMNVVETLAKADAIVFDKTGTITHADEGILQFEGKELSYDEKLLIRSLTRHSTHPLSVMIFNSISDTTLAEVENFTEEPGKGISGIILNNSIRLGSASFTDSGNIKDHDATRVYLSINKQARGSFTIRNKYREGLEDLICKLKERYELHLISGDNSAERSALSGIFPDPGKLKFSQSPEDKLEYVKSLKANGRTVIMIGDGLNDAGALKEADAGIAVPDNIYNFSPACDAILAADRLGDLHELLNYSRKGVKILKATLFLSFLYNLAGISFAVTASLTPLVAAILMPMSSVTAVAFSTGMTHLLKPGKKS